MPLRRLVRSLAGVAMSLTALLFFGSCSKDIVKLDRNHPPQTFIVAAPLDSSGISPDAATSSYRVHLYWRGEDSDGYVVGFLWEFDDSSLGNAHYTTKTDSVFDLLVNDSTVFDQSGETPPGTSKYHTFYIRAVDNQGKVDPGIAVFNHRTFLAQTVPPTVTFVGGLPSHRTRTDWSGPGPLDSVTVELLDTLADKTPFHVCWTGYDPDNPPDFGVPHYKYSVGVITSGLTSDTCAYFNDASSPASKSLSSGLYTMAVTAYDIANAAGTSKFSFVVNYDPDTWFLPRNAPIGHYLQPFREGTRLIPPVEGTFAPGDTVPYRSTVWWDWDASDSSHGESNCITGYSVNLQGSHDNSEPYTIGFLNDLGGGVLFKTNNPAVVGPAGYVSLILDSLDAVPNMQLFVRSQDCSGRIDGTPAFFTFSCDYPPELRSIGYRDTCVVNTAVSPPAYDPGVYVFWDSYDYEDGKTLNSKLTIDGTQNVELSNGEQGYIVLLSVFNGLSPGDTVGTVRVRVADRAGALSDQSLEAHFTLPDSSVCAP